MDRWNNEHMNTSVLLDRLKLALLPSLGAWIIRFLGTRLSLQTRGAELVDDLYGQGKRIILAFWHGRQLMIPLAYRGSQVHILISQHRDGELIHRIVTRFGFRSVRGSTTRGGPAALRQLIRLGRSGVDLVVTPDGPKGQGGWSRWGWSTLPGRPVFRSCRSRSVAQKKTLWQLGPLPDALPRGSGTVHLGGPALGPIRGRGSGLGSQAA